MFPNIRLVIVALLATITGISCGLGLFAAFRVNREPFAHLPNGAAPLQLVFAVPGPAPATDAAPFGIRFQVNVPQAAAAAADTAPDLPAPNRDNAAAPVLPPPAATASSELPSGQSPSAADAKPAPDIVHHRVAKARRSRKPQADAQSAMPLPAIFDAPPR
jgi:hypothetical protein